VTSKKIAAVATTRNQAKPKIAQRNFLASGQTVQKWFSDALKSGDVKPSLTACKKFAREFQIIVNRQNNAELESCGSVSLDVLGDVSPEEYLNGKVQIGTGLLRRLGSCWRRRLEIKCFLVSEF
jgi:hypothetical protein